ncbi:MAG TPA: ABC transporter ATP-binding protein [Candidatus Methylomirabilis sp.]|nr:ABC transporter ATP-binding protein [Candidatus Methylomirabilis sp.]
MNRLAIRSVGRDFGSVVAVRDFSLELAAGEFVSLLGPSGCGKTTMLRMIAGFIAPSRGTIELNGRVVSSPSASVPPEKRGMSMIFQSYAIWPHMTVAENVAFGLTLRRLPANEISRRVNDMLGVVRLSELAARYPAELSGGQQQRVALARAIVIQPEVLLLDEPLSNLDANLREEMRFEIRRLHDAFRMTTVYVTHDQAEAMVTSDRIVVMSQGSIEQIDTPYNLYNAPRTRFVASFIGRTNFLAATLEGERVAFRGFSLPAGRLRRLERPGRELLFSLRPQSIRVSQAGPVGSGPGEFWVQGKVVSRSYFGERWDYGIDPGGGVTLMASAEARQQFQVGDTVWMVFDPEEMIPITM